MKKKASISFIISLVMLIFAIGYNLWLYRLEPTAQIDPNDNAFQYALVDRTAHIWNFANDTCSSSPLGIITFPFCHFTYLIDHWVHNWAQGYNLPYYYTHFPQIAIVATHKLTSFISGASLFTHYHYAIYLLLAFFPLSLFAALRVIGLPWLTAGFGAIIATHISTDGLYGLGPPSFLWRGWGLSSQLFAMIFLPLAFAYSYRWFLGTSFKANKKAVLELVRGGRRNWSPTPKGPRTARIAGHENFDVRPQHNPTRTFWLAALFIILTTSGHLGIGIITIMSLGLFAIADPVMRFLHQEPFVDIWDAVKRNVLKLALLAGTSIFFLSYWIVPILLEGNYHNFSWWDPVWKFDSYGWKTTILRLFNGELFDWGRGLWLTGLIAIGLMAPFIEGESDNNFADRFPSSSHSSSAAYKTNASSGSRNYWSLYSFSFLFIFWLLLYFGRTTWGGLIDLIPGMTDFHISRFIVGLHIAGLFVAPIGFTWLVDRIRKLAWMAIYRMGPKKKLTSSTFTLYDMMLFTGIAVLLTVYMTPKIYKQTAYYNDLNDRLIVQANDNFDLVKDDVDLLFETLRGLPPGRIFAGRGGWWGRDFEVAETPYYMHISTYGLPTVTWLPETWSLNSDTEQFFTDAENHHYDLYNIKYVVAPPDQEPQDFWELYKETDKWKLYTISHEKEPGLAAFGDKQYITVGTQTLTFSVGRHDFVNVVHKWIQSDLPKKKLFPEITFDDRSEIDASVPLFTMRDEVTYVNTDGTAYNLYHNPPPFEHEAVSPAARVVGEEEVIDDMIFRTTIEVDEECRNCLVILKQTSHPNWVVKIDGTRVDHTNVFPFFVAAPVGPGTHEVEFAYRPGKLKVLLLVLELGAITYLLVTWIRRRRA